MGIYKKIFQKGKQLIQTNKKRMTEAEKKARREKIKTAIKKVGQKVQSGELQKVATVATRYSQGKPVILKKSISKEESAGIPKEIIIFGVPVPTPVVAIGTLAIIGGIVYATKKRTGARA